MRRAAQDCHEAQAPSSPEAPNEHIVTMVVVHTSVPSAGGGGSGGAWAAKKRNNNSKPRLLDSQIFGSSSVGFRPV